MGMDGRGHHAQTWRRREEELRRRERGAAAAACTCHLVARASSSTALPYMYRIYLGTTNERAMEAEAMAEARFEGWLEFEHRAPVALAALRWSQLD